MSVPTQTFSSRSSKAQLTTFDGRPFSVLQRSKATDPGRRRKSPESVVAT